MVDHFAELQSFLRSKITEDGPMGVDAFMGYVLGAPDIGYYMNRDPLGLSGDFTTAPEISQMFGEMVGAWLADIWAQHGSPSDFILLELGPGRGTLMADIVRICAKVPGFMDAAQIHLIEISPVLKARQRETLSGLDVYWHDDLSGLPNDKPIFFIANEFFDALPFKQFIYKGGKWAERLIDYRDDVFAFIEQMVMFDPVEDINLPLPEEGKIFELSRARQNFMADLVKKLKAQCGAGLIIDYGHLKPGYGGTFQALRSHEYTDPLKDVGHSDVTSHVDFSALSTVALAQGVDVLGLTRQGDFLMALGIQLRAHQLLQKASGQSANDIQKALHRLVHSNEMGSLFKVMGLNYGASVKPAGF